MNDMSRCRIFNFDIGDSILNRKDKSYCYKNDLGMNQEKLSKMGFEPITSGLTCRRSTN